MRWATGTLLITSWTEAAERLGLLVKVDQLDGPEVISVDQLKLAAALLKAGDRHGYEQLRQTAFPLFTPTSDAAAYSILEMCLLLPPDPQMLQSLTTNAEMFAARFPTKDELRPNPPYGAQWSGALALLEYRRDRFINAVSWGQRCEGYSRDLTRQ